MTVNAKIDIVTQIIAPKLDDAEAVVVGYQTATDVVGELAVNTVLGEESVTVPSQWLNITDGCWRMMG